MAHVAKCQAGVSQMRSRGRFAQERASEEEESPLGVKAKNEGRKKKTLHVGWASLSPHIFAAGHESNFSRQHLDSTVTLLSMVGDALSPSGSFATRRKLQRQAGEAKSCRKASWSFPPRGQNHYPGFPAGVVESKEAQRARHGACAENCLRSGSGYRCFDRTQLRSWVFPPGSLAFLRAAPYLLGMLPEGACFHRPRGWLGPGSALDAEMQCPSVGTAFSQTLHASTSKCLRPWLAMLCKGPASKQPGSCVGVPGQSTPFFAHGGGHRLDSCCRHVWEALGCRTILPLVIGSCS